METISALSGAGMSDVHIFSEEGMRSAADFSNPMMRLTACL